jgi:hypothetical protein
LHSKAPDGVDTIFCGVIEAEPDRLREADGIEQVQALFT